MGLEGLERFFSLRSIKRAVGTALAISLATYPLAGQVSPTSAADLEPRHTAIEEIYGPPPPYPFTFASDEVEQLGVHGEVLTKTLPPEKTAFSAEPDNVITDFVSGSMEVPSNSEIRLGYPRLYHLSLGNTQIVSYTQRGLVSTFVNGDPRNVIVWGTEGNDNMLTLYTSTPLTQETKISVSSAVAYKSPQPPTLVCGIGVIPPWLCFSLENLPDDTYGSIAMGSNQLLIPNQTLSNTRPVTVLRTWDNSGTFGGDSVSVYPADESDYNPPRLSVKSGSNPIWQLWATSRTITPTADWAKVNLQTMINPCQIQVVGTTATSYGGPEGARIYMSPPPGTPFWLSAQGANLLEGETSERVAPAGWPNPAGWQETWNLSIEPGGVKDITVTLTTMAPFTTTATVSLRDIQCYRSLLPMISRAKPLSSPPPLPPLPLSALLPAATKQD